MPNEIDPFEEFMNNQVNEKPQPGPWWAGNGFFEPVQAAGNAQGQLNPEHINQVAPAPPEPPIQEMNLAIDWKANLGPWWIAHKQKLKEQELMASKPKEKQTIGDYFGKNSPSTKFDTPIGNPPYEVIDFSHIGIEIEIENLDDPKDNIQYWERKQDGSLRNNGWEYVSYPIKGNDIAFAISLLKSKLENYNEPIFSGRTSVHIHMNILDMTTDQLQSLIILYLCFERALYNFASPHRYKNIFCTPISQTGYGQLLSSILQGEIFPNIEYWQKYTGFNILPIIALGTVEFRHMKGNLDPEMIITWINIIQKLKIAAMKTTFEQLSKEIVELNTNSHYDMVTFQVFGELSRYIQNENLHKQMEQDVLFVKEALLAHKKPKYEKKSFLSSTLGHYLLRKENLLDYSILERDYSKYSIKECTEYLEEVHAAYKKAPNDKFASKAADVYTKLRGHRDTLLWQEQQQQEEQKKIVKNAKIEIPKAKIIKKVAIPKGAI